MNAITLQQFGPIFAQIKSRFDAHPSVEDGLICKQGFYMDSLVLKLQKASWTNDPMDQIQNQSGIFFSIWIHISVHEKAAAKNQANYNIHALKLRHLKRYSITSRDFAEAFRNHFAPLQEIWPNVSVKYGPQTLMQGWIDLAPLSAEESILRLLKQFEQLSPMIDHLLESRRR